MNLTVLLCSFAFSLLVALAALTGDNDLKMTMIMIAAYLFAMKEVSASLNGEESK